MLEKNYKPEAILMLDNNIIRPKTMQQLFVPKKKKPIKYKFHHNRSFKLMVKLISKRNVR